MLDIIKLKINSMKYNLMSETGMEEVI